MESLAVELFDAIVQNITDHTDLLTLRLVNRCFNRLFTPATFQKLRFVSTLESAARFHALSCSDIATYVTEISWAHLVLTSTLEITPQQTKGEDAPTGESRLVASYIRNFFCRSEPSVRCQSLQSFTNLRLLHLHFPDPSNYSGYNEYYAYPRKLQVHILCFIAQWKRDTWFMSLTSLSVTNIDESTSSDLRHPGFKFMIGRLKTLSIDVSDIIPEPIVVPGFRDACPGFAEIWLKPAEANLESLTLRSRAGHYFGTLGLGVAELRFTKLTTLELHGFLLGRGIGGTSGLDTDSALLLAAPRTLRHLRLDHCAVGITACNPLRRWADSIDRFRTGLRLSSYSMGSCEYINFGPHEQSYLLRGRDCQQADKAAKEALWAAIGQHSLGPDDGGCTDERCAQHKQYVQWVEEDSLDGISKTGLLCVGCLFSRDRGR